MHLKTPEGCSHIKRLLSPIHSKGSLFEPNVWSDRSPARMVQTLLTTVTYRVVHQEDLWQRISNKESVGKDVPHLFFRYVALHIDKKYW